MPAQDYAGKECVDQYRKQVCDWIAWGGMELIRFERHFLVWV